MRLLAMEHTEVVTNAQVSQNFNLVPNVGQTAAKNPMENKAL